MLLSVSEIQDHKIKTLNLAKPIASITLSMKELAEVQNKVTNKLAKTETFSQEPLIS